MEANRLELIQQESTIGKCEQHMYAFEGSRGPVLAVPEWSSLYDRTASQRETSLQSPTIQGKHGAKRSYAAGPSNVNHGGQDLRHVTQQTNCVAPPGGENRGAQIMTNLGASQDLVRPLEMRKNQIERNDGRNSNARPKVVQGEVMDANSGTQQPWHNKMTMFNRGQDRRYRQDNIIIGRKQGEAHTIISGPAEAYIKVWNITPTCEAKDMKDMIIAEGVQVIYVVQLSKPEWRTKSFKITIPAKSKDKILNPEVWADAVKLGIFFPDMRSRYPQVTQL